MPRADWKIYMNLTSRISIPLFSSFLRNGYSMREIDEATAEASNYRRQMTLSKILEPTGALKNAPVDRFASSHDSEVHFINERRRPRRNSCESSFVPTRRPRRQSNDSPCCLPMRVPHELSTELIGAGQFRMPRRWLCNSAVTAQNGSLGQTVSSGRFRRNSISTEYISHEYEYDSQSCGTPRDLSPSQRWSSEEPAPLQDESPVQDEGRKSMQRYHSAPIHPARMALRPPSRTTSPLPTFAQKFEVDNCDAAPFLPDRKVSITRDYDLE